MTKTEAQAWIQDMGEILDHIHKLISVLNNTVLRSGKMPMPILLKFVSLIRASL